MGAKATRWTSPDDIHPGALQGVEQRLTPLERRLVERNGMIDAGLRERDIANPFFVRARYSHDQKLYMEAPDGTSEDFKHAAIERDNPVPVDFDFEQAHNAETYQTRRPFRRPVTPPRLRGQGATRQHLCRAGLQEPQQLHMPYDHRECETGSGL